MSLYTVIAYCMGVSKYCCRIVIPIFLVPKLTQFGTILDQLWYIGGCVISSNIGIGNREWCTGYTIEI